MDRWMGFYSNVKPWMLERGKEVEERGYVYGIWGLKRRLPSIMSKEEDLADLKRQAGNFGIQSYASDFNCFLLLLVMEQVRNNGFRDQIKVVNTVHDSIVFEVTKGYEPLVIQFYYEAMASMNEWCADLFGGQESYIDMRGDLEIGHTYGDLKEVKVSISQVDDHLEYSYITEEE